MENALYAEIDRLEEALVIANNTITLMASDINRLKYDNAVLTGDIDEWRKQWVSLSEEVAKLTAQRDKAGSVSLELEQRCAELDMELSRVKQKEAE